MSKWFIKALLQRSFSISKNPEKINRLFQKYLTGKDKLNEEKFGYKILHASDHIAFFKKHSNKSLDELNCLELGTGQFPIVPIFYFLNGMNHITSIDVVSFMTKDRIEDTLNFFIEYRKKFPEKFSSILEDRWKILTDTLVNFAQQDDIHKILKNFGTEIYIADARKTKYPDNTFDFITSNNTFEHIYPEILEGILKEFQRILEPNGIMSHFIDMTDHFAHFDNKINVYNFLKFSDKFWHRIDNEILPQSRLRFRDYLEMYSKLNIPITDQKIWDYDVSLIDTITLNKKYQNFTKNELAIVHVYVVSSK